jgi:hypothetical protein
MSSNRIGPNGPITFNSGLVAPYNGQSSDYTATADDYVIGVDTTGGALTVTLATATVTTGRIYIITDSGGNATAANITLATEGAETIDGNATAAITADDGNLQVVCDGTNWFTI